LPQTAALNSLMSTTSPIKEVKELNNLLIYEMEQNWWMIIDKDTSKLLGVFSSDPELHTLVNSNFTLLTLDQKTEIETALIQCVMNQVTQSIIKC
jgi:hypothetical protein